MSEAKAIEKFEFADDNYTQEDIDWAFPPVSPGMVPFGGRVIVQLRRIKKKNGRIVLV